MYERSPCNAYRSQQAPNYYYVTSLHTGLNSKGKLKAIQLNRVRLTELGGIVFSNSNSVNDDTERRPQLFPCTTRAKIVLTL